MITVRPVQFKAAFERCVRWLESTLQRLITGFQARSRGGRWSWTLTLAQKRSRAGRWSWAAKVGLLSLRVVPQQQCNGHCPCDCPARQLKQQLCSALVAAQWRVDTALTLPLLWRQSTVSPVFFGRYPRSSLHALALFPSVPVPNKPPRFCGHKAKWSQDPGGQGGSIRCFRSSERFVS